MRERLIEATREAAASGDLDPSDADDVLHQLSGATA